jgi:hypothetical protein
VPSAALTNVHAHRHSVVTASAAGALLFALWFIPSANAPADGAGSSARDSATSTRTQGAERVHHGAPTSVPPRYVPGAELDSGFTAPQMLGSLGLTGAGAVLIIRLRRRAAARRAPQTSSPVTD